MSFLHHWHTIAYTALGVIAIIVYGVHFFRFKPKNRTLQKVFDPESLLVILIIFSIVLAVRVDSSPAELREDINRRLGELISTNKLAERISNPDELFRQLSIQLDNAKEEVYVTSLRRTPGEIVKLYPRAAKWYKELPYWPSKGINRRLYRVIGTATVEMTEWFKHECAIAQHSENVRLRGVRWSTALPAPNAVVFDDSISFLILSPPGGPVGETVAYRVEGEQLASSMRAYVDHWLKVGEQCAPGIEIQRSLSAIS